MESPRREEPISSSGDVSYFPWWVVEVVDIVVQPIVCKRWELCDFLGDRGRCEERYSTSLCESVVGIYAISLIRPLFGQTFWFV